MLCRLIFLIKKLYCKYNVQCTCSELHISEKYHAHPRSINLTLWPSIKFLNVWLRLPWCLYTWTTSTTYDIAFLSNYPHTLEQDKLAMLFLTLLWKIFRIKTYFRLSNMSLLLLILSCNILYIARWFWWALSILSGHTYQRLTLWWWFLPHKFEPYIYWLWHSANVVTILS